MNPIAIILGILIIIVLYLLYTYLYPSNVVLSNSSSLSVASSPITNFTNPSSTRYTLGIWVYINSLPATESKIYSRETSNAKLSLSIDPASGPTLLFKIKCGSNTESIVITDNFPIQKWVCVLFSVDNSFVDAYIDGKLVISKKLSNQPDTFPADSAISPINLGSNIDGTVARFTYWSKPINPQEAYDFYMNGNGQSIMGSKYGANLNIIRDNIISTQIKLF